MSQSASRPSFMRIQRRIAAPAGVLAFALTAAIGVVPAGVAQAATASCPVPVLSQPFLKWSDSNYYSLVPGGSFETSPGEWSLAGGAARAAGSEPYGVTGSVGSWSLGLPGGSAAQSPFMCVEPNDRTFRFFARSEKGEAVLRVQLVYQTAAGYLISTGSKVSVKSSWEPSAILHTGAAQVTAVTGETAHLALRFTVVSGSARIDDVFLDPRRR